MQEFPQILGEIILLDGITCLYRFNVDLYFYVLGAARENELVFFCVTSQIVSFFLGARERFEWSL